jgi:hypothetical protein
MIGDVCKINNFKIDNLHRKMGKAELKKMQIFARKAKKGQIQWTN